MSSDDHATAIHLHLAHASARLARLDPETTVLEGGGLLACAESHPHPAIANLAFRVEEDSAPEPLVARARQFFGGLGRGFCLWVRGEVAQDEDLIDAAEADGLKQIYEMPEMVCAAPVDEPALDGGAELELVETLEHARDYWQITAEAYKSLAFPPEVFSGLTDYEGLWADDARAFVAYLEADGERVPAAAAMTIVSDGVAGIYWVGAVEPARGRGLARAVTAAATNAGFELGAEFASLQASPMGAPLYRDMGYETLFPYRLLMASAPR